MTDLASVVMATEFPDGGRFVSAAEAEQIIKRRISVKGTRREFYEVTEEYTKIIPPIKDYAELKKKLEKFGLSEQALVQLINLAPTSRDDVSEHIPGGDDLNTEVVDEIIEIITNELASAKSIDDDMGDMNNDIKDYF